MLRLYGTYGDMVRDAHESLHPDILSRYKFDRW